MGDSTRKSLAMAVIGTYSLGRPLIFVGFRKPLLDPSKVIFEELDLDMGFC